MKAFNLRRLAASRPYVAVTAGAVIALALGGTGFAIAAGTLPVSGGNIHACYSARTGALRVLTSRTPRCRSGEHPISWTQSSLGNAFSTTPSTTAITLTTSPKTVATLHVPAGKYLVTLTAEVFNTGPNALDWVNCILRDSRGHVISAGLSTIPFDSSAGFGAENMAANGPTSRAGAITANCFDQAGQAAVELISLEATPVNKLTG
jgi:hypothetical protein